MGNLQRTEILLFCQERSLKPHNKWCWEGQTHTHRKTHSEWAKDSKITHETIKLLEEDTGEKLCDIGFGNDVSGSTPKAQATRAKMGKCDCTKLKSFCTAEEAANAMKRQPTDWGEISASHLSDQRLRPTMYKEPQQLNSK